MSYDVGDMLIAKREITWTIDKHTSGRVKKGEVFVIVHVEGPDNHWLHDDNIVQNIDLLGVNHLIRWTDKWSPMEFLFDRIDQEQRPLA